MPENRIIEPTAEREYAEDSTRRLKAMGIFDLQESPVAEMYVFLVELVDLDLRHLEPGSPEAFEAFERHRSWLSRCYLEAERRQASKDGKGPHGPGDTEWRARGSEDGTIVPSEYAVGFPGRPAFEGERTAIAKAFALMVRAGGYTGGYTHGWIGRRWWIVDGAIRSKAVAS